MKKIIITVSAFILAFAVIFGAVTGYIYYDFHVNGIDTEKFAYMVDFETEGTFDLKNINAEFKDGKITSSSDTAEFLGVTVTASICETEGSGSLVLRIHQKPSVYTPFNAEYLNFAQRVFKENGTVSYAFPGPVGTGKNGEKLIIVEGSSGYEYVGENDVKTYEYWIRDAEHNPLKAEDIDEYFPISITHKGHKATYSRTSIF